MPNTLYAVHTHPYLAAPMAYAATGATHPPGALRRHCL